VSVGVASGVGLGVSRSAGDGRAARWEHAAALAGIALATLLFSVPIHAVPERMPAGHDYALAVSLGEAFAQGLADGHAYPRWVSDANEGFGLPALVGYPPLSGALVGVVRLLVGDLMTAFLCVILLVNFTSGVSFYVLARRFARPGVAGLGAALYILMPYHFVVVYHRFAFAEFSAAIWVPLVLHFGLSLRARPSLGAALGLAASFAAVVLSHVVVAQMVVVAIGTVILLASRPHRHPRRAAVMVLALIGAALIGAAYIVPLLLSRDLTHWDAQYRAGRVLPFLFTHRGDEFTTLVELAFLTQVLCFAPMLPWLWRKGHTAARVVVVVGLLVIALHLSISLPIWEWLPGMQFLLYPYRFGLLLAVVAPLGLVWTWGRAPVLGGLAALACLGALATIPTTVQTAQYVDLHATDVPWWNQEHIPRTVDSIRRRSPMQGGVRLLGAGEAEVLDWRSHSRHLRIDVQADEPITVRVGTWYYPGWEAVVDGRPRPLRAERRSGLITMVLGPGEHDVRLRFRDTPDRTAGKLVTVLALLGFAGLVGLALWRRRRARRAASVNEG